MTEQSLLRWCLEFVLVLPGAAFYYGADGNLTHPLCVLSRHFWFVTWVGNKRRDSGKNRKVSCHTLLARLTRYLLSALRFM